MSRRGAAALGWGGRGAAGGGGGLAALWGAEGFLVYPGVKQWSEGAGASYPGVREKNRPVRCGR